MKSEIQVYNDKQTVDYKEICDFLATTIDKELTEAESKIWHGHPVWFLAGNPIVGYSKQKNDVQLLFWSGQSFEEEKLKAVGTFKAAGFQYTAKDQINLADLKRCLNLSKEIQWDYLNIMKRKGQLNRIK